MGTVVEVWGSPEPMEPWFREVEAALSRFDPASSLSQLNRRSGRWTIVPPLLYRAIEVALEAARMTGGAFDPTVLDAVEAAGYGRSFELGPTPVRSAQPAGRWQEIRLDSHLGVIYLPPGVRIDLGGIGKGLAVDWAMKRLASVPRLLINAGGDLAVRTVPGDAPVVVEVQDPFRPEANLASFPLVRGAVATSSTLGRRWPGGHHLIDPATGRPAETDLVAATVIAGRTARAETLAKAAIVLGLERALALLERARCHGLLVTADGSLVHTPGLEVYLHAAA